MSISRRLHIAVSYAHNGKGQCEHLRMAGGRDEVEESMHPVVPETRVTLDSRLFSENIVILAFKVADDLLEAAQEMMNVWPIGEEDDATHANSLSMLSPNPGVSTMVRAMRTPSSSSSVHARKEMTTRRQLLLRTDVDRLDPDTFFNVRSLRAVADLVREDLGLAEGVHERRAAGARGPCDATEPRSVYTKSRVSTCHGGRTRGGEKTHRRP